MTAGSFSYADAAKLLGSGSKTLETLDRLTGGLLLAATGIGGELALSLFDAKGELARLSAHLGTTIGDHFHGLGRFQRTQRIAAAHAVIVVTAFFESAAPVFGERELGLLKSEQAYLAGGSEVGASRLADLAGQLLHAALPCPGPAQPYEVVLESLDLYYGELAERLVRFVRGLSAWEAIGAGERAELERRLSAEVPVAARERYAELFHRLGTQFPEIAYWSDRVDHQATRGVIRELDTGLRDLRVLLESVASDQRASGVREAMSRAHAAALDKPIMSIRELPRGVHVPLLGESYVSPCFRLAVMDGAARPAEESWWDGFPIQRDLQAFLFGFLTHPVATQLPLLVLGQPGAGKSVLTKILAAQLPAGEFVVTRVALREVPAQEDLQTQIEWALRQATGHSVSWPELHDPASDAVALVILDGFDELLQATAVSNSSYLQQVVAFQEREAALGRPTAVIITSRTAVADRAQLPMDGVVIRLEPFQDDQVERWLSIWNRVNAFEQRGLLPLTRETVLVLGELARQPLLLLMIALYDADGNLLQREGPQLREAALYEKLLAQFARREVTKAEPGLTGDALSRAVDAELLRLSIVAFSMFNRDSQWASAEEIDSDLAELLPEPPRPAGGFQAPLSAGELVIGRFFFVHEAEALRDDRRLNTYEFLHATFGEYLVARLTAQELMHLAAAQEIQSGRARRSSPDDDFLNALLSFSTLSARESVLRFLEMLVADLTPRSRAVIRGTLLGLFRESLQFRESSAFHGYQPGRERVFRTAPARFAVYSINLLLMLTLVSDEVAGSELSTEGAYAISTWRNLARFWRSQMGHNAWLSVVHSMDVTRTGVGDERNLIIRRASEDPIPLTDLYWTYRISAEDRGRISWIHGDFTDLMRQANFLCDIDGDALMHALEPLSEELGRSLISFAGYRQDRAVSATHALVRLWLLSSTGGEEGQLAAAYLECFHVAQGFLPVADDRPSRYLDVVIGHLRLDADRLRGVLTFDQVTLWRGVTPLTEKVRAALEELGLG